MERSKVHLVPRASCTSEDTPGCTKPTSTPTVAIVVAVLVPLVLAVGVLIYLHRRHLAKLREEDAKDKYKSLDFGMGQTAQTRKANAGPEMSVSYTEKGQKQGHDRGMSLDIGTIGSPYILPAGLHGSRESFHSLSRSMHDSQDPYRPVTFMKDDASMHSNGRGRYRNDNGSMYTTSSGGTEKDRMNNSLLKNASRMSQSFPPRGESMSPPQFPPPVASPSGPLNSNVAPPMPPLPPVTHEAAIQQNQNSYVAFQPSSSVEQAIAPAQPALPDVQVSKAPAKSSPSPPPFRIQSQEAVVLENMNTNSFMSTSSYGDGVMVTPPSPPRQHTRQMSEQGPLAPAPLRPQNEASQQGGLGVNEFGYNTNRLSIARPLPPDDPHDNPEQRANRIRSFYKEYFDDSKPEPVGGHVYNEYYEDYRSEYQQDGAIFDQNSRAFVVAQPQAPFAQPVTRRAMTPPPRAPPRFRSGSNPQGPHISNGSVASSRYVPPRGMSSMSGRLPAPAPRRPMPPPAPLASLPTPAKLTEDSMIFDAADFAPPISYRDRQAGRRPDSPLGAPRPFSPAVRPHTPLATTYDDLAPMPSPHLLRKSGTFTALDFAPPPRFRDPGSSGSDAGSIRSNRSGMSAAGRMAVRTGAYRVSRIPKEIVGTRDDIMGSLRPTMDMVAKA